MNKKPRILIVDDEPINREFFDVMLGKLGFKVELAADGGEALDKVKLTNPDLILLDNVMPDLSGWKVTRMLKSEEEYARYRDVPIIMFSEMDSVEDKIEGYELGVEDYIIKPFNFSEVLARIRAVLRNRALTERISRREQRISLVESLNQSLVFFTSHLEQPLAKLIDSAKKLDGSDASAVKRFVKDVIAESEASLAAVKELQDEIAALDNKKESLDGSEIDLHDLEERFQKQLAQRKDDLKGARR